MQLGIFDLCCALLYLVLKQIKTLTVLGDALPIVGFDMEVLNVACAFIADFLRFMRVFLADW